MKTSIHPQSAIRRNCHPVPRGFSLLEMLIVMAVLGILIVLTLPAFVSIALGTGLNRAGQMVGDQLALARQEAVTKNRDVQIWFVELEDAFKVKAFRGLQIVRVDEGATGPVTTMVGPLMRLPDGFIINTGFSPLLEAGGIVGTYTFSGRGTVAYRGVRIRANGSLDSAVGNDNYLMLQGANDVQSPPKNYYIIQINPITARITVYRP